MYLYRKTEDCHTSKQQENKDNIYDVLESETVHSILINAWLAE